MKKSNKILLITGLATVTIGTAGILHTNYMQQLESKPEKIKAYNHQPANILDNVFIKDNVKYLPFIFERATENDNITPKKIKKDEVVTAFRQKGLTIKNISTGEKIVTGTQITVQENSDVYNVVIYGDINADGQVNVLDVQKIIRHVIYMGEHELKGTYKMAANLQNSDDAINVLDAQKIIKFCLDPEKNKILLNEPISEKEADKTAPVITLIGNANIELEEGDSYTDEGVTATDNCDGDVTAEVSIKITFVAQGDTASEVVGQVDTNRVGTYTITYTVSDSNGNTASKTRTIVVNPKTIIDPPVPDAKVESIELKLGANFKTQYQYGEATKLDLTGAQIEVKTDDGKITTKNITNSMLSSYDLTTEGTKTITVTYEGVTATDKIEITVLNKISELVMNNTGMNNAQTIATGYQTNSKEEFVLGTVQAKQVAGSSILQQNQLKATATVVATTDNTVTASDLAIRFEADADGNILVKGKAEKVGNYTIKVYIEYGSQKVEKEISLNVKKSDVVGQVKVLPTVENEVIKVGAGAKRKLTVININGEEIEVTNDKVIISEKTGITITKLNAAGKPIGESAADEIVDSLQIATTLETEQTITMDMTVNGKAADFTFTIKAKSVLTSVEIQESELNIHAVLPSNNLSVIPGTTTETLGNIYTLIKPIFKDQYGDEMTITDNDIKASCEESTINKAVQNGKIGILLPKVDVKITGIPVEVADNCIDYRSYQGETIVSGEDNMNQFGFSIILNNPDRTVNLEKLAQASIVIKCGSQEKELPIKVHYKTLTNLGINTSTITLTQNDEGHYTTKLNEEFTLGVINVGAGETPVTADMLTTEIIGDRSGITISYTSENGRIVVKGTVTKEGVYQIKPKVGNVTGAGIDIRGISTPEITSIEMADFELQRGEQQVNKELIVKSDINPTLQPIMAREITFIQKDATTGTEGEFFDIILRNASNQSITAAERPDEVVKSIDIKVKDDILDEKTVILKIILFAGEENEYSQKEVAISIKQPIPKGIEIGDTITLHDNHIPGETVEGADGIAYTLLPVELFADENNTRKLSSESNLFAISEDKKENRVYFERPTVTGMIAGSIPAGAQQILSVKYFSEHKEEGSQDIAYVGIGIMKPASAQITYNKSELNGAKINVIIEGNTVKQITINYTENS